MSKSIKIKTFKIDENFLTAKDVYFVSEGCKWFFNAQHKLHKLSPNERMYLDYMCEKMNSRNKIQLNKEFRNTFIKFAMNILSVSKFISERSLLLYENKLKELYLIFNDNKYKGITYVNPKHFFKGTDIERERLLKNISKNSTFNHDIMKALTDVPLNSTKPNNVLKQLPFPDDFVPVEEIEREL
jgi:hypothetical protein